MSYSECPDCSKPFNGKRCKCGYVVLLAKDLKLPGQQPRVEVYAREQGNFYKKFSIQKCSRQHCNNPGTLSHSNCHDKSDSASWYCRDHFRFQ